MVASLWLLWQALQVAITLGGLLIALWEAIRPGSDPRFDEPRLWYRS